jgi:hypothetical protein
MGKDMFLKCAALTATLLAVATPAAAQEREWLLDAAEEDVYLLFGVPNTNDVGVSFWCRIGEPEMSLFSPLPANAPADQPQPVVLVRVDDKTFTLAPRQTENSTGSVEAPLLEQQQPLLDSLKGAERFSVTITDHTSTFPLDGADFNSLLGLCTSKPAQPEN